MGNGEPRTTSSPLYWTSLQISAIANWHYCAHFALIVAWPKSSTSTRNRLRKLAIGSPAPFWGKSHSYFNLLMIGAIVEEPKSTARLWPYNCGLNAVAKWASRLISLCMDRCTFGLISGFCLRLCFPFTSEPSWQEKSPNWALGEVELHNGEQSQHCSPWVSDWGDLTLWAQVPKKAVKYTPFSHRLFPLLFTPSYRWRL